MRQRPFIALAATLLCGVGWSCSGTEGALAPRIVVTPGALVFSSIPLGSTDRLELLVENEGSATLRVSDVAISTDSGFVSLGADEPRSFTLEPGDVQFLVVEYTPTQPRATSGTLRMVTNDPQSATLTVEIDTPRPTPLPNVVPAVLDFGVVAVNTEGTIDVRLRNAGFAPLILCSALVTGSAEIRSNIDGAITDAIEPTSGKAVIDLFQFSTGVGVPELEFEIYYRPGAPGDDNADLVLEYDANGDIDAACEPGNTLTSVFPITGSAGTPLLAREPCPLDFGERALDVTHERAVTLANAGELPLVIYGIRIVRDRSADSFGLGALADLPRTLDPGETLPFPVTYRPTSIIAEAGVVEIEHTDPDGGRVVSECRIAGVGSLNSPPIAVARGWMLQDVQNRRSDTIDWAIPLQTLVLDGSDSYDPDGNAIVDYFWDVYEAPPAALAGPRQYDGDPDNPSFAQYFVPLAGRYQLCLTVTDISGFESEPSCVRVVAIPDRAIAIELTWDNPLDPDQTDNDGSDLDLHFVRMPHPWFDPVYDVYFGNPAPLWDPESPTLDIDDTDGLGPETIQLDNPSDCQWYAVGVHYFRLAYGTAWPTVRIFINGRLIDEIVNQPLDATDDFWDVARIHWPTGTIYRVNTLLREFDSRAGIAPVVTDSMRASGLCGTP